MARLIGKMKKGNKQCLFDTPRTVMVNKKNDIRIQRPKNMQKAGFLMNQVILYKSENCLSSQSCHFVKNYFFSIKLLHANFQFAYNVKAKYQVNPSKAEIGVDRPVYALS